MRAHAVARFAACAGTVVLSLLTLAGPLAGRARARTIAARSAAGRAAALTPTQLALDLREGTLVSSVPANLNPTLSRAWDGGGPAIGMNGCTLKHGGVRIKRCIYGDTRSHTSVVVFGDSHAAMWWPALSLISRQQHWRLIDLTKAGCPPVEVTIAAWFLNGAPYPQCTQWRVAAIARIAALRPSLVIVSWERSLEEPEARTLPGVPGGYGSAWQNGVAAIFNVLRHAARHVVFISDGPTLSSSAPLCLAQHRVDVQACVPTRSAATSLPAVRADEFVLARREGIPAIDPMSWFCTPTRCPVIVGNILLYRDNSHMTAAWSRFIAPVLTHSIVPIMRDS